MPLKSLWNVSGGRDSFGLMWSARDRGDDGFASWSTRPPSEDFCLEDLVPADHRLRAIDAVLDLSWHRGELKAHYSDIGRASVGDRSATDVR